MDNKTENRKITKEEFVRAVMNHKEKVAINKKYKDRMKQRRNDADIYCIEAVIKRKATAQKRERKGVLKGGFEL